MDMIGHHDECIQRHMWEMVGDFIPAILSSVTGIVQLHDSINDITEQIFMTMGADGNKIHPTRCIIMAWQPDGPALVDGGIMFHFILLC
jgi:muconolactone delta-isomerase